MRLTSLGATAPRFSGQNTLAAAPRRQKPHFGDEAESSRPQPEEGRDRVEKTTSTDPAPETASSSTDTREEPTKLNPPKPEGTRSLARGVWVGFGSMTGVAAAGIALTITGWGAIVGVPLLLASPLIGIGLGFWQGMKKK